MKKEAEKPKAKENGTNPLIPLFTGHKEYTVDSEAILKDHARLKTKPAAKPKTGLNDHKKQNIAALKKAIKPESPITPS